MMEAITLALFGFFGWQFTGSAEGDAMSGIKSESPTEYTGLMRSTRKSDPTSEWLSRTDLSRYGGLFVAIVNCRVVASGKNARTVAARARKRHPRRHPVMWKVPTEDLLIV